MLGLQLFPFITYSQSSHKFEVHNMPSKNKQCSFVNIIEVKNKDYQTFTKCDFKKLPHENSDWIGVYFTNVVSEVEGKDIRYLVLEGAESREGKFSEKFQDLFAGIMIALSHVCVFDLSSKYLRNNQFNELEIDKQTFVVMNTSGGRLYKAKIQTKSNKMEIEEKVETDECVIRQEFLEQIEHFHEVEEMTDRLRRCLNGKRNIKNCINLEDILNEFTLTMKLKEFIKGNCTEYHNLILNKQKQSIEQMFIIERTINSFRPANFLQENSQILVSVKKELNLEIQNLNKDLTDNFIQNLKQEHFSEISTFTEMELKIRTTEQIFKEYGIMSSFMDMLTASTIAKIQNCVIISMTKETSDKETKIMLLTSEVSQMEYIMKKNEELLKSFESKSLDFKTLNLEYTEKTCLLEKERESNHRNKTEIEVYLNSIKSHKAYQEELIKEIHQLKTDNQNQQFEILVLKAEIKKEESKNICLNEKITEMENKIEGYKALENQAWKSMEEINITKYENERYKDLLEKLEENFETFKKGEFVKFNCILKKNFDKFTIVKQQSEKKSKVIEEQLAEINRISAELEEEKTKLKFCQEQIYEKIMKENCKTHSKGQPSKGSLHAKSYDLSFIENVEEKCY